MSERQFSFAEFDDSLMGLIEAYCEGAITPEEADQLHVRLADDPKALDRFVVYLEFHARLRRWALRASHASAPSFDPETPSLPESGESFLPLIPPLSGNSQPSLFSGWPSVPMTMPFWGSICLVAVALTGFALGWFTRSDADRLAHHERNHEAVLVRSAADPLAAPSAITGGNVSAIEITSGTTRIELPGVGHVVLDGPAKFEMIDSMRARLTEGRARVRVTEESGHGFVVETPDGKVIDLGTEFGLEVGRHGSTSLVVFDGAVDLERPGATSVERLIRGEGVTYRASGPTGRIMSIVTGRTSTFERGGRFMHAGNEPVIVDVTDNIVDPTVRKFYEIVPGGLREDALAYIDREAHEWNGVSTRGMPSYLIGADYVKMFSDDKGRQNIEVSVTLSCPAKLFVFHRDHLPKPRWMFENFRDTGDKIGLDVAPWRTISRSYGKDRYRRGTGAGMEIDYSYSVWECEVPRPGVVRLGANTTYPTWAGMYGIAAVRLPPPSSESEESGVSKPDGG